MRYFLFVIFVLSIGSVSAQNSARVRELEKQRKAALAEIEMTNQLLNETRQTCSPNRFFPANRSSVF